MPGAGKLCPCGNRLPLAEGAGRQNCATRARGSSARRVCPDQYCGVLPGPGTCWQADDVVLALTEFSQPINASGSVASEMTIVMGACPHLPCRVRRARRAKKTIGFGFEEGGFPRVCSIFLGWHTRTR